MNPTTDQLPPPPPPQLPLQPSRSSFSCDRHPDENFSGFCPLCLYERLTTLDQSATPAAVASSSRRNSTSSATASSTTAAALKSLFKLPSSSSNFVFEGYKNNNNKTSFFPELRRTKSFSASKNEGLSLFPGGIEPQRKSCDVRNTLCSLFSIDDENKLSSAQHTVLESNKEVEDEEDEIKQSTDQQYPPHVNNSDHNIVVHINEIEELEETTEKEEQELKTMQHHIDLDSYSKKPPTRSNFWSAASNLGKKWQKWRRKPKKSDGNGNGVVSSCRLPVEKPISRQYRETKSEIADYGFGRRSCDIDPRFSLDAGRISYDDPRQSFDEPRASWDGYIIGRTFPRLPPMVEDVPVVPVAPSDTQISVEQSSSAGEDIPGGSIQTREYYTDSSSKRRKSLDRSNSIRKMAAAVVAEMDETKTNASLVANVSNAKVSPATIDYGYGNLGLRCGSIGGERELARDSNASSLRDDCSETFELGLRDQVGDKKDGKKSRRWRWKLWGFIHRRGGDKNDEENGFGRANGVERSYSGSWQETGMNNNRLFRSNSTMSWRNGSYSTRKSNCEINGKNRRIGGDEFVLERNRSAKYSPNHADSGLLRFYLTPLRGSRRSKPISSSNPIPRNTTRLH